MVQVERIQLTYNNVYVVDDGGARLLVDTGPDYPGAHDAIVDTLAGRLPDLVVATHGHIDHASLGKAWQELGVPVLVGEGDIDACSAAPMTRAHEFEGMRSWANSLGAPVDIVSEVLAGLAKRRDAVEQVYQPHAEYPAPVEGGRWPTPLRFRPFRPGIANAGPLDAMPRMTVVLAPGHTPGNLVLIHESGLLFSGDQLLPDITPTPAIQGGPGPDWRFRSLPRFVESMKALQQTGFTRCYPGHGEPFENVQDVIAFNLEQVRERGEKVLAALGDGGPGTLYEIGERMYPRALRRRFWQILSTLQGNIDLLEESGLVQRIDGERWMATPV